MTVYNAIDAVNRETMRRVVDDYAGSDALTESEHVAIASIADTVRGKRILDIGVGGGRTTLPLLALSQDYVGVDYVEAMIEYCRQRFPGVRFEHADARSMPQFADGSFDLIVFSLNGLSMVNHDGRLAILREVRRLLSSDGVFVFSTYNSESPALRRGFVMPDFRATLHPVRYAVRALRFLGNFVASHFNRWRYRRHEVHTDDYAIINDRCHNYRTLLYYIAPASQRRQLEAAGFDADIAVYDLAGRRITAASPDDSLTYVVRAG